MKTIYYSHYLTETELLGPYKRAVLWVQGCCFSCEGCIAKSMQKGDGTPILTDKMAEIFLEQTQIEGITISGGEPFLQAEALSEMVTQIRKKRNLGVIVYSGLYLKELERLAQKKEAVAVFLGQIDLLIDGRYEKEQDDGRMAVGSANQTLHFLTSRYRGQADYYEKKGRKTEIRFAGKQMQLIGVPTKEESQFWEEMQMPAKK